MAASRLSSQTAAGVTEAPAASLRAQRKLKNGEYPPAAEIRALMANGLSETLIGQHYGRSVKWAQVVKKHYGIRSRKKPALAAPPTLPRVDNQIMRPDAPAPTAGLSHGARYAAFFAEHGQYPSFSDAQIRRYEARWALRHPSRKPAVIDIAPAIYGDPGAGRAA